jgi:hypothetical protein
LVLEGIMVATKTNLTFAVFQRSELSLIDRAKLLIEFDAWEQQHLDAARTSEERLNIWDETQNAARLANLMNKHETLSAAPHRLSARAATG